MAEYFGRYYDLIIGTGDGLVRQFTGNPNTGVPPLQIAFTIDQTPSVHRAWGEITLYGLNRSSRKQIYEQFTTVTLKAGYLEAYGTIFSGQIMNVEIGQDGPNPFVKLFCQSGAGLWENSRVFKNFGANTTQREIIESVAAEFSDNVTLIGDFGSFPRAIKGRTIARDAKSAMNQLAESFDFSWFLTLEEMIVIRNGTPRPDSVPVRYTNATGIIGTPEITEKGVDIDVLLNPNLRPWDLYTVETETAALTFSGIYFQSREFPRTSGESTNYAIGITHEGDYYGDTWQTSLEGIRVNQ